MLLPELERRRPRRGWVPIRFPYAPRSAPAQLFIDQFLVREAAGVSFTQHPGRKHPANPLLTPDQPWEPWAIGTSCSVLYDEEEKLFKMWYGNHGSREPGVAALQPARRTVVHVCVSVTSFTLIPVDGRARSLRVNGVSAPRETWPLLPII